MHSRLTDSSANAMTPSIQHSQPSFQSRREHCPFAKPRTKHATDLAIAHARPHDVPRTSSWPLLRLARAVSMELLCEEPPNKCAPRGRYAQAHGADVKCAQAPSSRLARRRVAH